jgi:uroporphyrinogen decarboxylase
MAQSPKPTMTPRERVRAALAHQEPDRVPLDLGSTGNTGITAIAYRRLLSHLGIEAEVVVWDRMQQLAVPDERALLRLGIDTRGIWPGGPDNRPDRDLEGDSYEDEWGVARSRPPGGYYYDLVRSPLAGDVTMSDVRSFPWPDPDDPGRVRGLRDKAIAIRERTPYALVVHASNGFITRSQYLRGFEDWFTDLLAQPDLVGYLMDHTLEFQIAATEAVLREVGDIADVVMFGDDIGVQHGPMVSPQVYRKLVKPRQAKLFARVHELTSARLLYHTCGSVVQLIDDLIEIGVEVLNPVQVAAAGMDTEELKRRFGDRIAFWGGVDTQRVMPMGTPDEVRAEARRRIRDLAPGGGYVVDTVHNVQADVPPENICALYEEAAHFGHYPIQEH